MKDKAKKIILTKSFQMNEMKKKILITGLILAFLIILIPSCNPPEPPPEKIKVEVCTESELLPTVLCPETIIKEYEKGKEPTEYCDIHKMSNPGPPWIGTSCYQAIVFPLEDIEQFIRNVALNGGNCTEFFLAFTWPVKKTEPYASYPYSGWKFAPYEIVEWWSEPKFGDYKFPKFDISREGFRDGIWVKWSQIFRYCKKYGVIPVIRIQCFCSIKDAFYKRHYPFEKNIQKGKEYDGGMWGGKINKFYSYQNEKLIEILNEAELEEFFIVIMNEADVLNGSWPGGEAEKNEKCIEFHKWYIEDLQKWGVRKEQIIINTSRAFDELRKLGHIMEIHGCNSDVTMIKIINDFGTENIVPNGDGPDAYAEGRQGDKPTKREPSVEQGRGMRELIKKYNIKIYIYYNRNIEFGIPPDIKRAEFDVLRALTGK